MKVRVRVNARARVRAMVRVRARVRVTLSVRYLRTPYSQREVGTYVLPTWSVRASRSEPAFTSARIAAACPTAEATCKGVHSC